MQGNGETVAAAAEAQGDHQEVLERIELRPITLRFRDPRVEGRFRRGFALRNLGNARAAHVIGILMMIAWGFAIRGYLPPFDRPLDFLIRYGVIIPVLAVGFGVTFLRRYPRFWEWEIFSLLVIIMPVWVFYVSRMRTMPPDFGYVGLILMAMFVYTLIRTRFLMVLGIGALAMGVYIPYAVVAPQVSGVKTAIALFYLVSFTGLGALASYRGERNIRMLFVREHQLDEERHRSDSLLLNILPEAIVDRLKRRPTGRLAEELDEVSVLFADAVEFTRQAAKTGPDEIVAALDELFRRFDVLADRHGLEKIKTVGDAYMAVAGAPVAKSDHAEAAAEMALAILEESAHVRWPSGDPIVMRIGVATGPVVAGVIGQRKFAYDLWGDTVNLASRLEEHGQPGRVMVSEEVARRLEGSYEFAPQQVVDLKGMGPTPVRFLLGRAPAPSPQAEAVAPTPPVAETETE